MLTSLERSVFRSTCTRRLNKVRRASRELAQEYDRKPTIEEIAERVEMTVEKVTDVLKNGQEPMSLETPVVKMAITNSATSP